MSCNRTVVADPSTIRRQSVGDQLGSDRQPIGDRSATGWRLYLERLFLFVFPPEILVARRSPTGCKLCVTGALICMEELWWRHHDVETISALLAICGVTGDRRNGDRWCLFCCYLEQAVEKNTRITGNLASLNPSRSSDVSVIPTPYFALLRQSHCVLAIMTTDNKRDLFRRGKFSIDQRVKTWIKALDVPWNNSMIISPIISDVVANRPFRQWPCNFHWKLPCHCLQLAAASDRSENMQLGYCCCNVCKFCILLQLIHFPIECELEVKHREWNEPCSMLTDYRYGMMKLVFIYRLYRQWSWSYYINFSSYIVRRSRVSWKNNW